MGSRPPGTPPVPKPGWDGPITNCWTVSSVSDSWRKDAHSHSPTQLSSLWGMPVSCLQLYDYFFQQFMKHSDWHWLVWFSVWFSACSSENILLTFPFRIGWESIACSLSFYVSSSKVFFLQDTEQLLPTAEPPGRAYHQQTSFHYESWIAAELWAVLQQSLPASNFIQHHYCITQLIHDA